jgi:hypothetical protein
MVNEDLDVRQTTAVEQTALPELLLFAGEKYTAGELFEGVAAGDTKAILIENGSSDRALATLEPTVNSSGQFFTTKIQSPTVDTAGNAATIQNPKSDATATSPATVTTAGDGETGAISGGDALPSVTSGSGSNAANASPGQSGTAGISDVIMPGDSLAIQASNESGSIQDISIVATFLVIDSAEFDAIRF